MAVERGADVARSFLVVVDGSPECEKALRFAALRARHTGGRVMLLTVVHPQEFLQWGGVQKTLEEEAEAEAWALLEPYAKRAEELTGVRPVLLVRKGQHAAEVMATIREDRSIRVLVLAAADKKGRPGPLVESFAGDLVAGLPCMLMIVPGGMEDRDIDRLT